jgi:hypothetical protein
MTAFNYISSKVFIAGILLFKIVLFCSIQESKNQIVTWTVYKAADNSDSKIRIKDEGYGVAEVHLFQTTASGWENTEIISIDIIQEYIQLKSKKTGKIFELFIDWQLGKIVLKDQNKTESAYWKANS